MLEIVDPEIPARWQIDVNAVYLVGFTTMPPLAGKPSISPVSFAVSISSSLELSSAGTLHFRPFGSSVSNCSLYCSKKSGAFAISFAKHSQIYGVYHSSFAMNSNTFSLSASVLSVTTASSDVKNVFSMILSSIYLI